MHFSKPSFTLGSTQILPSNLVCSHSQWAVLGKRSFYQSLCDESWMLWKRSRSQKSGSGHLQCTKASRKLPAHWLRVRMERSMSLGQCNATGDTSDNCKCCPGLGSRILWVRGTTQMKVCLIWFPFRLQLFVKTCFCSGCVWQGVLWGANATSHTVHWQDVARQTAQLPINSRQQYLN